MEQKTISCHSRLESSQAQDQRFGAQVRLTSGLAASPQFSPFSHSGLQRSFYTAARSDMFQGLPMAATPPGLYHPSLIRSHGYHTPVASMGQQGIDKAAVSAQCPPLNLQQHLALTSPATMAAYPVTTFTQMSMTGVIQPGIAVTRAFVVKSSERAQEVNQTAAV